MKNIILVILLFLIFEKSFSQDRGSIINICSTIYDEFAPSLSADGRTLIYQSNRDGEYKLYESHLESTGKWSDPLPITSVNTFGSQQDLVAGPSISYDGNTLFFCASYQNGYGNLDIYYSLRTGNTWSKPINIGLPINSSDYEGFPCISADGKRLYFTRILETKKEGEDCFKIMYSEKLGDKWSLAKELPAPINSGCDKAPRIMSDNKTLVFASIREGGKGNYDLYTSRLNDLDEWEEPVAMNFVNTLAKEQYASVDASGENMLYYTNQNIQKVNIPFEFRQGRNITLQGFFRDLDTQKPLEGKVTIKDALTTQVLSTLNSSSDGRYTAVLASGKKYTIEYSKQGYNTQSIDYDFTQQSKYIEIKQDAELFSKVEFRMYIIDYELFIPIDAQISIIDNVGNQISSSAILRKSEGEYLFNLDINKKYKIEIKNPKYAIYDFELDLSQEVKYNQLDKTIKISPFSRKFTFNIGDLDTGDGLPVDLYITNLDMDEQIVAQAYMSRDGKHTINLRDGNRYKVEVKSSNGYSYFSSDIAANDGTSEFKIGLIALKPGSKLLLKDIYFDFNSTEMKQESYDELQRVNFMLKQNPSIKVEVAAHTDNVGSEAYNKKLSDKRAKYVMDYMISKNIDNQRLKAVGYGKSYPIFPNDSEENRAKNRRLELKVIEN